MLNSFHCLDEEGSQHRENVDLSIDVTDVNDNIPVFMNGNEDIFVDSSNSGNYVLLFTQEFVQFLSQVMSTVTDRGYLA